MSTDGSSRWIRLRVILVCLMPALFVILLVTLYLANSSSNSMSRQSMRFGNTMADQLALTSTDYLINQDKLSLNIMLRDLLSPDHFEFAAIYDADGTLVTQAGKAEKSQTTFTRDITFQNTVVGHLSLGLNIEQYQTMGIIKIAAVLYITLGAMISLAIWFYGDLLYLWILGTQTEGKRGLPVVKIPSEEAPHPDICWLIIKLKPDRLIVSHIKILDQACQLYSGEFETRGDDIIVSFNNGQHIQNSICCGLLIKAISELIPGNLNFKAGIDIGSDESTTSKQAAYLASISEQHLLVSRRIRQRQRLRPTSSIQFSEYRHSLISDGEVYVVTESDSNPLISQQASQLYGSL